MIVERGFYFDKNRGPGSGGGRTVKVTRYNLTTGVPYGQWVVKTKGGEPPSIDEVPPPGVEGKLSKAPPEQPQRRVPGIERSQPRGDLD